MQPVERVIEDIRGLEERIARSGGEDGARRAAGLLSAGTNPLAYALEEVARLRQIVEGPRPATDRQAAEPWVPRVSVYAGDASSKVLLEVPGVVRDDISVTLTGSELVVRGERRPSPLAESLEPVLVEQVWGAFERRFQVPDWCTPQSISARCSNGVLEIDLTRKSDAPAAVRIEIG